MSIWRGFFESLKSFIKWRGARKAQKERFRVFLAEDQLMQVEERYKQLKTRLDGHVELYHGGEKPPKKKPEKDIAPAEEPFVYTVPAPYDRDGLVKFIGKGGNYG